MHIATMCYPVEGPKASYMFQFCMSTTAWCRAGGEGVAGKWERYSEDGALGMEGLGLLIGLQIPLDE